MKLTKCDKGHFYDADKFPECPYCNTALQRDGGSGIVTAAEPSSAAAVGAPAGPVTGWLVVLDGPARGRDLRLGVGRTLLGADNAGQPATLSADAPLSARLAQLVYDPAEGSFTLLPGTAQELAYLEGKAVLEPRVLQGGEELRLLEHMLKFVPFCGTFRWEK